MSDNINIDDKQEKKENNKKFHSRMTTVQIRTRVAV